MKLFCTQSLSWYLCRMAVEVWVLHHPVRFVSFLQVQVLTSVHSLTLETVQHHRERPTCSKQTDCTRARLSFKETAMRRSRIRWEIVGICKCYLWEFLNTTRFDLHSFHCDVLVTCILKLLIFHSCVVILSSPHRLKRHYWGRRFDYPQPNKTFTGQAPERQSPTCCLIEIITELLIDNILHKVFKYVESVFLKSWMKSNTLQCTVTQPAVQMF